MMVSCPGCNNKYLVDDRKIPAKGGSLTCRECGKKWKVSLPQEQSPQPPMPGQPARPAPPPDPIASIPSLLGEATPRAGDSSANLQKPVNCPKCGHFFVPYTPRSASRSGARKTERPRGRVLLVEDQKYFAELTREALDEDFETIVTSNLSSARKLLTAGGFDLVILDLSLDEGQDGTQVLQCTKGLGIPVLIFTARDETDLYGGVWDQLKAAGATDILIKGMNVGEELRQKVQSLLISARK